MIRGGFRVREVIVFRCWISMEVLSRVDRNGNCRNDLLNFYYDRREI